MVSKPCFCYPKVSLLGIGPSSVLEDIGCVTGRASCLKKPLPVIVSDTPLEKV